MFIEVKGEFDFGRSMVRSEVETRMISVNELRVVKLFFFSFVLLCLFCFNDAGHFPFSVSASCRYLHFFFILYTSLHKMLSVFIPVIPSAYSKY